MSFLSCGGGGPGHHKLLKVNSYLADICGGRAHSVGAGGGGCGGGLGEVGVVGAGGASTPNTQDTAHSKSISTSTASSSTDSLEILFILHLITKNFGPTEHSLDERQVPLDPLAAPQGSLANFTMLSSPSLSCLSLGFPPRGRGIEIQPSIFFFLPKAVEQRKQRVVIRKSIFTKGLVIVTAAQLLKL